MFGEEGERKRVEGGAGYLFKLKKKKKLSGTFFKFLSFQNNILKDS